MELREPSPEQWAALSEIVAHVWFLAAALVMTGVTYMLAHAMIPSLAYTADLSASTARRLRAPLYTVMALGLVGIVTIFIKAVLLALELLPDLYGRLAI